MPRRLKEVLPETLRRLGGEERWRRGAVLAAWKEVVGRELARLTEAVALEGGILTVRVADALTAHGLTYSRLALLRHYEERFPGMVREIRFVVGQVGAPPSPGSPAPEDPEGTRKAWELAREALPELRGSVARAALALLRHRRGEPCPICESPSEAHPCPTCRRLLESPAVRKGAERLKRGRAAGLEGEALLVARHLARQSLLAEMAELFPQALREEGLRPLLGDLARRFQALFPDEPLPEAVRSLLAKGP
ncbi:DUF721 domain-containing protein [Thermus thermamylovorans]|uniref:DUF721 domain-containing protein n=1 Tax=Thermus thermamylovorans TaxID=2509362 RepID=UPI00191C2804|nr:DUF721 domain-containing protein [Thermus thermamylovorans]